MIEFNSSFLVFVGMLNILVSNLFSRSALFVEVVEDYLQPMKVVGLGSLCVFAVGRKSPDQLGPSGQFVKVKMVDLDSFFFDCFLGG